MPRVTLRGSRGRRRPRPSPLGLHTPRPPRFVAWITALADLPVRTLPPSVFCLRPQVDSAVVRIEPKAEKRAAVSDLPWFHFVVRQVFRHRRKNLRVRLARPLRDRLTKPEVDDCSRRLGLTGLVRTEAVGKRRGVPGVRRRPPGAAPGSQTLWESRGVRPAVRRGEGGRPRPPVRLPTLIGVAPSRLLPSGAWTELLAGQRFPKNGGARVSVRCGRRDSRAGTYMRG